MIGCVRRSLDIKLPRTLVGGCDSERNGRVGRVDGTLTGWARKKSKVSLCLGSRELIFFQL